MTKFFFDNWLGLARVLVVGVTAYAALVVLLRVSRKRTLSKLNAFDLIVTVALGSTLATVLLSKDVPLAEGVLALALLVFLQFAVAWLAVRVEWFDRLIKSEPAVLFYRGRMLHGVLRRERVTEGEVRSAVRAQGIAAMDDVEAVILETDGSLSAVRKSGTGEEASALSDTSPKPDQPDSAPHSASPR